MKDKALCSLRDDFCPQSVDIRESLCWNICKFFESASSLSRLNFPILGTHWEFICTLMSRSEYISGPQVAQSRNEEGIQRHTSWCLPTAIGGDPTHYPQQFLFNSSFYPILSHPQDPQLARNPLSTVLQNFPREDS